MVKVHEQKASPGPSAAAGAGPPAEASALELIRAAADPEIHGFLTALLAGPRGLSDLGIDPMKFAQRLGKLRFARAVERRRAGRSMTYELTPVGEALARGIGAAAAAVSAASRRQAGGGS